MLKEIVLTQTLVVKMCDCGEEFKLKNMYLDKATSEYQYYCVCGATALDKLIYPRLEYRGPDGVVRFLDSRV